VALLVKGQAEEPQHVTKRCKQFEIMWKREHTLPEIIHNIWDSIGDIHDLGDVDKALSKTIAKLHE
jgi:hypothetical protein